MGYTTIANVAGMFPTFKRGIPQQLPADSLIQQFVDDIADVITAVLERRFNEAIQATPAQTLFAWLTSLGLPNTYWYPALPVQVGAIVLDNNSPCAAQVCTVAGTTDGSVPTWSATFGATTTDGTVTWMNAGQTRQLRVLERGNRYGAAMQLGAVLASFGVAGARKIADEYDKSDWKPFIQDLNAEDDKGQPKAYGRYDVLFDSLASIQTPRPILSGIAGGDQPRGVAPDLEGIFANLSKAGVDYGWHSPSQQNWNQSY